MRTTPAVATNFEEAGDLLLQFAVQPENWVTPGGARASASHLKVVDGVQVSAAVELTQELEVYLRVSFRGADLSPMKASELLESVVGRRMPFKPNTEWQVQIDGRRWIHFSRRYAANALFA